MKPLVSALAFVALLAALVAVGLLLLGRQAPPPEEIPLELTGRPAGEAPAAPRTELPRGGIYAGIVVDREGAPIRGAGLLLVAWDTGEEAFRRQAQDPDEFDPSMLAIVGFRTAAEGKTDAAGRFRIAADQSSAIRAVFAWREGYSPALVPVEKPQEGIRIVLDPPGQFVGTVVDADTGEPIPNAEVAIYLQQRALDAPETIGERVRMQATKQKVSFFAVAQRWVAEVLGPRVWGVDWRGDETIRTYTDRNGSFRFAPVNEEVQLEFVITHPEYEWTEFDRAESGRVDRTVVPAGETVERIFKMQKGKSIEGKVVDERGQGVPDVLVSVEHVAQYAQHWWYRTKKRRARTRQDGSFRVAGLSLGPYTAMLEHPAFGREHVPGIPQDARDLQWHVQSLGALAGRVEGLQETGPGTKVGLVLEALGDVVEHARHVRLEPRLDPSGAFVERGIRPGRWRVWVQRGSLSSTPEVVEIRSLEVTPVTFTLGGGGRVLLRVWDAAGRAVDPAMVTLVRLAGEDGNTPQPLGRFVTREGRLDAQGIVPGRYRARVEAAGYLAADSEPFVVDEEGRTDAGEVTLREPATVRFTGIVGPDGRVPEVAVHLSLQEGDGPVRPLPLLGQSEVPVRPGPVTVRATADDGTSFEATYEVVDGEILPVRVQLAR